MPVTSFLIVITSIRHYTYSSSSGTTQVSLLLVRVVSSATTSAWENSTFSSTKLQTSLWFQYPRWLDVAEMYDAGPEKARGFSCSTWSTRRPPFTFVPAQATNWCDEALILVKRQNWRKSVVDVCTLLVLATISKLLQLLCIVSAMQYNTHHALL